MLQPLQSKVYLLFPRNQQSTEDLPINCLRASNQETPSLSGASLLLSLRLFRVDALHPGLHRSLGLLRRFRAKPKTDSRSSGRAGLLPPSPLRTVRESFPSYGSSLSERLSDETRKRYEPRGEGGTVSPENLEMHERKGIIARIFYILRATPRNAVDC